MVRLTITAGAALASVFSMLPDSTGLATRTEREARSFAERGVAHIHQVGRDQAFADFSRRDGRYVDGELFMFCYTQDGVSLAHGGNPGFVGENMLNVRDPDGKFLTVEMIRTGLDQGAGWVDFRWPNPASETVQARSVYVIRVDPETVCGSGYFKN